MKTPRRGTNANRLEAYAPEDCSAYERSFFLESLWIVYLFGKKKENGEKIISLKTMIGEAKRKRSNKS